MRYQYGISIVKGYPVAFTLVALLITSFELQLADLAQIFLFSLIYAVPTGLISYFIGFYLFKFVLIHIKASYAINVLTAGFVTSIAVGLIAGLTFSFIIRGNIYGGSMALTLFFIVPTLIAGLISSLFFWNSTK